MCNCKPEVLPSNYKNQVTLNVPDTVSLRRNTPEGEPRTIVCIDRCLEQEIKHLWSIGIATTGCCCGHNVCQSYIGVEDRFIQTMKDLGYRVARNDMYPDREDSFVPKTIQKMAYLGLRSSLKKKKTNPLTTHN